MLVRSGSVRRILLAPILALGGWITTPAAQAPPSPFTIPTIDLAAERWRQVVVDRESGQYLGHVTTVLLEDGRTMIAVYPKGHGRGRIYVGVGRLLR